ncbi:hypothetical protein DACRYDRAFT_119544 [Dacryopinax primogenitus]|uniref:Uncharacterized protein n=1 Tax=Dacryopinax primogenitus (strain DJM 731) TaxID=1858805 RepID=M5FNH7_DACPD|nr:uncharacterized protein DACRYDRAFT_119544 [Dacryopinax primogenitus]EJT97465.1 hypothetical protein DACRYDRAFT_119544 [Dacryopinax primogenitus]
MLEWAAKQVQSGAADREPGFKGLAQNVDYMDVVTDMYFNRWLTFKLGWGHGCTKGNKYIAALSNQRPGKKDSEAVIIRRIVWIGYGPDRFRKLDEEMFDTLQAEGFKDIMFASLDPSGAEGVDSPIARGKERLNILRKTETTYSEDCGLEKVDNKTKAQCLAQMVLYIGSLRQKRAINGFQEYLVVAQ